MVKILVVICIIIIFAFNIANRIKEHNRVKKYFIANSTIKVDELVTFSIYELASQIKKYRENSNKTFLIEYKDDTYLELTPNDSKEQIRKKLGDIQDKLIRERYIAGCESPVKDAVISIMHDIWIDYAHIKNYESAFWRQMYRKLCDEKISNSLFNIIYKKFYGIRREFTKFKL